MATKSTFVKVFLSTEELADYLGVSVSAIIAYRTFGTGPKYQKIGRLCRYRISDVEKWIAENNPPAQSQSDFSD